jgi:cytochrome c5
MKTGEQVYQAMCMGCHANGPGPKFGDAALWSARIKTGYDALLNSALKGKGGMGAMGGGEFTDYEIARAVVYIANAGGAKFAEPVKPAPAAAQ